MIQRKTINVKLNESKGDENYIIEFSVVQDSENDEVLFYETVKLNLRKLEKEVNLLFKECGSIRAKIEKCNSILNIFWSKKKIILRNKRIKAFEKKLKNLESKQKKNEQKLSDLYPKLSFINGLTKEGLREIASKENFMPEV